LLDRLEVCDLGVLGVWPGARVLDVGCQVGRLMFRLQQRGCVALGVDIVRHDVESGRRNLSCCDPAAHFLQADGGRLPFADASFDFVTCTETLEHAADDGMMLRELVRVLRPGGRLALSVPDILPELVAYRFYELYSQDPFGHRRIYTRRSVVKAVEAAGLRVYARRLRNSVEAVYWSLLFLLDSCPYMRPWAVDALNHWHARANEPSAFYNLLDGAGNQLFPKSIVVYAEKPLT
jgi:SAM-dependent methyltransferase